MCIRDRFTIGQRGVFSLGRWSSRIPTEFLVFRGTWGSSKVNQSFAYGAITHYGRPFQTAQLPIINPTLRPRNPDTTVVVLVWATPRSLAATYGITIVFFS